MTWKRTSALVVSLIWTTIWTTICAVPVFAQPPIASKVTLCADLQHLSATNFDDMQLEDLLNIEVRADAAILVSTMPALVVATNADFMEQVIVPQVQTVSTVQPNSENKKMQSKFSTNAISSRPNRSANASVNTHTSSHLFGSRKRATFPTSTK
jgi:hypothetical protein